MDNSSPHSHHKEFSKPCVSISPRSRAALFVTRREQFQALQTHLPVHHKHKLLQPRQAQLCSWPLQTPYSKTSVTLQPGCCVPASPALFLIHCIVSCCFWFLFLGEQIKTASRAPGAAAVLGQRWKTTWSRGALPGQHHPWLQHFQSFSGPKFKICSENLSGQLFFIGLG